MRVSPLTCWLRLQALGWLPLLGFLAAFAATEEAMPLGRWWVGGMAVSGAVLVGILRAWRGIADVVTMARGAGLLVVVGVGWRGVDAAVWSAAVFVVLLDLVDGALARRFGGSPEGAVLDMETDQFTVLGLSALVVVQGGAAHVLVLPAMRYGFVLAMWWLRAPAHDPKPVRGDNRRGRRICAAVMVALLFALWPGLPAVARDGATGLAVLLLAWSFGSDAGFLLRHARSARSRA